MFVHALSAAIDNNADLTWRAVLVAASIKNAFTIYTGLSISTLNAGAWVSDTITQDTGLPIGTTNAATRVRFTRSVNARFE